MANTDVHAWRDHGLGSRLLGSIDLSDDGLDFPPTAHPVRELLTFGMALSGVIVFIAWGATKLL